MYNKKYFRDGMIYLEFQIKDINTNPYVTAEEKVMFADRKTIDAAEVLGQTNSDDENETRSAEEASMSQSLQRVFFKGERVKIISGELQNLEGVIEETNPTTQTIQLRAEIGNDSEILSLKESEVVKVFESGTHVKVIAGEYVNQTGDLIFVEDSGNFAIISCDHNSKGIRVFINYLTASNEVFKGLTSIEGFQLYDLVSVSFLLMRMIDRFPEARWV